MLSHIKDVCTVVVLENSSLNFTWILNVNESSIDAKGVVA